MLQGWVLEGRGLGLAETLQGCLNLKEENNLASLFLEIILELIPLIF